jgi:hypothetical protein
VTNRSAPRVVVLSVLAGCAAAGGVLFSTASAAPRRVERAAGQTVPLPHVMRDNIGVQWDITNEGVVNDGGNDLYDGGGRLDLNNAVYQSPQQQAQFDPALNELLLPAVSLGGLNVSRRVAVNAASSWCRWTEILENPGAAPVRTTLHLHWDLGGSLQQGNPIADEKKKTAMGLAIFDGQRGLAMLGAGRGGKVVPRYQFQQNSDIIEQYYDVEVPAKKTVAVVHFQAMRANINDAAALIQTTKDKELLEGIPKDIRRVVVNFKQTESLIDGIELPRGELLDVVELRSGDQYRGTLKDSVFKLETFHGPVELPLERVIGMVTAGAYRPTQLFVTTDGEVIGGALAGDAIRLQLSSGQVVGLPLASVARVGCRKRPGEPESVKFDKPVVFLRDGQRLAVDAPDAPLRVATIYGNVELRPEWVASVEFRGEEQVSHVVRLRDGSRFAGLVAGDALDLRLRGAGSAPTATTNSAAGPTPPAVKFPVASMGRLQLQPPSDDPADENAPTLALDNGDVLVGAAAGTIELETNFDLLKLKGPEVRAIRHVQPPEGGRGSPSEVTLTMWDGATISGKLRGGAIDFVLKSGTPLRIPVSLVALYAHPQPVPPPEMLERIRGIVGELSNTDWKKRDRAAEQLRSIGQGAAGVLKEMREGQSPEAQKQIDTILKALEKEKAAAAAAAVVQTVAPGQVQQAVDFDGPQQAQFQLRQ